jgi:hypothetical protein
MSEIHSQTNDDTYARQSFTFRRMKRWQLWSITVAGAAIVIALLLYAWV